MGQLNIIVVEDRPLDAGLVERELRQGGLSFSITRADNEEDFRRIISEVVPDIILSDLSMPLFDGIEALAIVREEMPEVPLIFVSGTIGEEKAVDLLKLGATDFVLKQHLSRLTPAVRRALREVELKREQTLARERYRSIFENATIGIFQATPEGRFLEVNPALATMHGYASTAEMMASVGNGRQLIVEEQRVAEISDLMKEADQIRNFEVEYYRADRSRFWALLHTTVVRDARGMVSHYEGFVVDVTRQRELEQQMLRAQRMESIGTLASGVAHDLNNIISPIMMAASVLSRDMTQDEHDNILGIIETSARRGAQIVRQVLTLGRGLEGERHPLQSSVLVKEVIKIVSETFPKDITLRTNIEGPLWLIIGDATQVHQVILNLCLNARDAMPLGGELEVRAENLTVDESYASMVPNVVVGRYVLLTIRDSGTGIPPEVMDRMFDPFFTTKGVGKGTGLGLSTVLGILKSHAGFIHAVSDPGRGATFSVYLPAAADFMIEEELQPAEPQALGGHGELILIVDDEDMICRAARNVLESNGYKVLTAGDGTEALAVFAQNQRSISAVLTDIQMPFMDGLALVRALRRMSPRVAIVASTGQGEKTRLTELRSLDVTTVLDKPYGAETLLRTIYNCLHP